MSAATLTRDEAPTRGLDPSWVHAQAFAFANSPQVIRLEVQRRMQSGQLAQAQQLGDAGLVAYPSSEDTVGISALLALTRGDFEEARELLMLLLAVQGTQAPDATYWMLARACHCLGDPAAALEALENGLRRFPGSTTLQSELQSHLRSLERMD